jgi:AraC family transcriptional regulator, exoenzyme S synthesis regulatory protein ExsA
MIIDLYNTVLQHPEHFRQLRCGELLFTQYDCPQQSIMQDLFSETNYIAYVISGKRIFHLPGEEYNMTEGKCVFAKKGGWIAEKEAGKGWCVLVFFIPDDYLKQFIKGNRPQLPTRQVQEESTTQMISLDVNALTASFFHGMLPYFAEPVPPPASLLELKFRELLFNLLINPLNSTLLSWMRQLAETGRTALQTVMEANYTYNLSMTEFAKIAGRSMASFNREFNTIYKMAPGKWLLQKRLDYARLLLHTTAKPVSEIVFESGFENNTHFSRVFKEKFGLSPLAFRKQQE